MRARVANSLRWWQYLAVLVGLVVVMSAVAPLAMSANQDNSGSVPVIVMARMRVNWCASRADGTDYAGTSDAPTMILAVDRLQSARGNVYPSHVGGRTVLDTSSSFRC